MLKGDIRYSTIHCFGLPVPGSRIVEAKEKAGKRENKTKQQQQQQQQPNKQNNEGGRGAEIARFARPASTCARVTESRLFKIIISSHEIFSLSLFR